MTIQSPEQLSSTPTLEQRVDVPRSKELFRGDINDAVIRTQVQTGIEIDKDWWDSEVGNHGSTESILERYDVAYPQYVQEYITPAKVSYGCESVDSTQQRQEGIVVNTESGMEEASWEHYVAIGSDEYERVNEDRIADGKIKIVKAGDASRMITMVASIKVNPETGQAISGHESRPDAESMQDTEKAFEDYLASTPPEQRFVVYEGDGRIFTDRGEAIAKASDSGLVQYLAAKEKIPTVSGEPTEAEKVSVMGQLGVGREELLALSVVQGLESHLPNDKLEFLAGYISYQAATLGIDGFNKFSEEEKRSIIEEGRFDEVKAQLDKKVESILPVLNDLYRPALGNQDLLIVVEGGVTINPELADDVARISMDKLSWSGEHRINDVAKLSMEMRDRVIYHRILEAYNSGKSPFIVYGGSHAVTLGPAIRAYVDQDLSNPEIK